MQIQIYLVRTNAARQAFSQAGSPTSMVRLQNNNPHAQGLALTTQMKLDWDKIQTLMNYQVSSPEVEAARATQAGRIAGLRNASYLRMWQRYKITQTK